MGQRPVSAEERMFSLILALVASPNGLTRDELLASVHGYAQDYVRGQPNPSLERKFERDKADLRDLGIPLETIDSPGEPGNTQHARYRIQKSFLEVPPDLTFTREELALVRAAALAWQEGSLTTDSRRAITKLQSMAPHIDRSLIGVRPNLRLNEPAEQPLRRAIRAETVVQFHYRKPNDQAPTLRTVSPLRLHQADGRWHLIAFDHDREDYRVFLLSRMSGRVKEISGVVDAAHNEHVDRLIEELEALKRHQVAHVRVVPGSRAEARLRPRSRQPRGTGPDLHLHTLDFAALAEELIGYGSDVTILGPDVLSERIVRLASKLASMHAPDLGRRADA